MYNITKTKEELAKDQMISINSIRQSFIYYAKDIVQNTYNRFWFNNEVTPQEFCDLMGNQAYRLFQDHSITSDFIKTLDPEYQPLTIPAGWSVEINQDGTVVCTYTEPTPEPSPEPENIIE